MLHDPQLAGNLADTRSPGILARWAPNVLLLEQLAVTLKLGHFYMNIYLQLRNKSGIT